MRGVPELDRHALDRQPELLGGDLRHRCPRPRADVLHRGQHGRRAVSGEADPRVGRRTAAPVPELRGHPDPMLPGAFGTGTHLVTTLPVWLRAPVTLHQLLAGERALVHRIVVGMVSAAELQRVEIELGRKLVDRALQAERALDESGRSKGIHRRCVQSDAVLERPNVLTRIEHLRRPGRRRQPPAPPE